MGGRRHHRHTRPLQNDRNGSKQQSSPANPPETKPVIPQTAVGPDADKPATDTQKYKPRNSPDEVRLTEYTNSLRNWTIGLVFVGLLTAGVLSLQWRTFEKTDETLRAAQRPWMKYDGPGIELLEPLTYANGEVKTKVRFNLRNTGNSPALKVIPTAKLIINLTPTGLQSDASQRQLCEPMKNEPAKGSDEGFISFPGAEEPVKQVQPLSASIPKIIGGPDIIFFTIVSCITYRFSFGESEPHQTGIIFNVLSKNQSISNDDSVVADIMRLGMRPPKPGESQISDVQLAVWHIGSFAN